MGGLEIAQVGQVALPANRSLHRHQIGERADRGVNAVDAPNVCSRKERIELHTGNCLRKKIQFAEWGRQMDRPVGGNAFRRNGRAVRSGRFPFSDQAGDTLDVFRAGIEDCVDIAGCTNHPMPDQRDTANQDVANPRFVQIIEDAAETTHC